MSEDSKSKTAAAHAMLQRLYHDNDQTTERDFAYSEHETAAADFQGMSDLRTVLAELKDSMSQEPPARGMDLLMASAAKQAAVLRQSAAPLQTRAGPEPMMAQPKPGRWQHVQHLFSTPSMLAAAAAVVTVAVVGTIYLSDGAAKIKAPMASSSDRALGTVAPPGLGLGASVDSSVTAAGTAVAAVPAQPAPSPQVKAPPPGNEKYSKVAAHSRWSEKKPVASVSDSEVSAAPAASADGPKLDSPSSDLLLRLRRAVAAGRCHEARLLAKQIGDTDQVEFNKLQKSNALQRCQNSRSSNNKK